MKVEDAKEQIKDLEKYIELMESYVTDSVEKKAIKSYILLGSVAEVAKEINDEGYRLLTKNGERKYIGKDISNIINSETMDDLHEMAKKKFKGNKGMALRKGLVWSEVIVWVLTLI